MSRTEEFGSSEAGQAGETVSINVVEAVRDDLDRGVDMTEVCCIEIDREGSSKALCDG